MLLHLKFHRRFEVKFRFRLEFEAQAGSKSETARRSSVSLVQLLV